MCSLAGIGVSIEADVAKFVWLPKGAFNLDVSFNTVEIISFAYGGQLGSFISFSKKPRESSSRTSAIIIWIQDH